MSHADRETSTASYDHDGLVVFGKSADFLREPRFQAAYRRGMNSGHHIARAPGSDDDLHIEWRIHVVLWAAAHASRLPGDFVECGVNTGIFSLAICDYLDFNSTGKSFWLFDTFEGIPTHQVTSRERDLGRLDENREWYSECLAIAEENFAPYPRAHLVRGEIPQTLASPVIDEVAFLSIDMNIAAPEVAALEYFWDKLTPGAPVVLDDYGWLGHEPQKEALDLLAAGFGAEVLTLPTGQGLLIRPPVE